MPGDASRSIRTFAVHAGISKSAAGRDLAALRPRALVTRKRRPAASMSTGSPGASCRAGRRSRCPKLGTGKSEARNARHADRPLRSVPERGTEEKPDKKNQGYARGARDLANQR